MFAWQNWIGNQNWNSKIITPETEEELIDFIRKAKNEKLKIRAFGSGHSCSEIIHTKNYLINTDKFNKILSIDKKNNVRVQAGIKLDKLNKELAKQNLALKNQSQITSQSLAGVVCTATHGSGKTGTFASFIKEVKLLTADGLIYNISQKENKNLFGAARTNLGMLGIVTEYTLECVPLFKVQQKYIETTWYNILNDYKKILRENDYFEFTYNIKDDSIKIRVNNIIDSNAANKKDANYAYEKLTGSFFLNFLPSPGTIYFEEEIAISINDFVEAAESFKQLLKEKVTNHSSFIHIMFRFVKSENENWLSPACNEDVVYFSVTTPAEKIYIEFYKKFYKLMLKYNGRPHWAKINYLTRNDVRKLYGQNYDNFIKVREMLDPDGMFSNDFTKKIFGK